MRFEYTPYFAFLCITAIISAIIAVAAWQRRSTAARTCFALMMVAVTEYATVAALEAAASLLADKIFWSKLEYLGSNSTIAFFLMFAIYFTHFDKWLTRRRIALLWIAPIFNIILVATNEYHHLIWSGFLPGPVNSNLIIYKHSFGFFWVMLCVYAYTVTGTLLLIKASAQYKALYRQQSFTLLVGSLVPILGSSAYMLSLSPPGLNITPMSFMLSGLCFFISIYRFRLFDIIPVARELLVENMSDGVIVLDVQNRIVDINPAAQRFIDINHRCIGQYARVLPIWSDIVKLCNHSNDQNRDFFLTIDQVRYFELQISVLRDRSHQFTGQLIVLHDITQRYQAEIELRQANQSLFEQLVEIETLQVKLQEQAIKDRLTGLFNRHYLDEKLPKELALATSENYSVALILMDIDYFKKINDNFGHKAGDLVLQAFGKLLCSQIRSIDMAFRLGGEEFLLVLPSITKEDAYQAAEQIRLSFQYLAVKLNEIEIYNTVSGGLVIFPDDGQIDDALLQLADLRLYAAKAGGRNCIKFE